MATINIMTNECYRKLRAYREILDLIEKFPNDQELGFEVRKLMNEYQKPLPSYNYQLDKYEANHEPTPYDYYMKYMKEVADKFAEMLSVENDYWDYVNDIQEKDPGTFYNFRRPNEQALIDLMLDHSMEDRKDLMEKIQARQKEAQEWLSKNLMTFEEFLTVNNG